MKNLCKTNKTSPLNTSSAPKMIPVFIAVCFALVLSLLVGCAEEEAGDFFTVTDSSGKEFIIQDGGAKTVTIDVKNLPKTPFIASVGPNTDMAVEIFKVDITGESTYERIYLQDAETEIEGATLQDVPALGKSSTSLSYRKLGELLKTDDKSDLGDLYLACVQSKGTATCYAGSDTPIITADDATVIVSDEAVTPTSVNTVAVAFVGIKAGEDFDETQVQGVDNDTTRMTTAELSLIANDDATTTGSMGMLVAGEATTLSQ